MLYVSIIQSPDTTVKICIETLELLKPKKDWTVAMKIALKSECVNRNKVWEEYASILYSLAEAPVSQQFVHFNACLMSMLNHFKSLLLRKDTHCYKAFENP